MITTELKQCIKCKENKSLDQFGKDSSTKCGLRGQCRSCRANESKKWQKANPGKVNIASAKWYKKNPLKAKNRSLMREYGISIDTYNNMLLQQNYQCAICKQSETAIDSKTNQPRSLAVDHCHETGKVRSLLCTGCNAAIGFIKENANTALLIAEYLKQHRVI